ncbi:hypothetical protein FPSE_11857 [Fusarium pseudograminearum CS3096]|uniref:F-box domain-containing protein n=1 Tax=Fusarium pseudograminearum (strain CS3096) TaxID=1028729 RepID=K3U9S8_FUSPC|nr:hypothetical protein FPSE_11857 [Fusarium pseudograminearum CS3096]EKJ68046.1 hypothetical protein FPSE_11857 [Fusarium pseudograminearum CS3096]
MAPGLEGLPIETVQQIASFLSHRDIRILSHSCRSLRSKLYRLLWSRVLIHGGENDLARTLKTFDIESEHGRATLAFIKKATIHKDMVRPFCHTDPWDTLKYHIDPTFSTSIPQAIMQTLQAMTSLKSLHLNILAFSEQQELAFLDLLQETPDIKLQHLTIRAGCQVAKPFILKCSHDLRSLYTYDCKMSAGIFKSKKLEKLRIQSQYTTMLGLHHQQSFFILGDLLEMPSLRNISNHFPALKTLILHKTNRYNVDTATADPTTTITIIVNTLKKRYGRLQRLAFNCNWIDSYNIVLDANFFHNLVTRIAREHRSLQELCVLFEPPQFYHWKRDQGITIREYSKVPNPKGFPFGVED